MINQENTEYLRLLHQSELMFGLDEVKPRRKMAEHLLSCEMHRNGGQQCAFVALMFAIFPPPGKTLHDQSELMGSLADHQDEDECVVCVGVLMGARNNYLQYLETMLGPSCYFQPTLQRLLFDVRFPKHLRFLFYDLGATVCG